MHKYEEDAATVVDGDKGADEDGSNSAGTVDDV